MKTIVLTFALITASVLMTSGQDKPKASPSPVASPTPAVSLSLTEAETAAGLKIQKDLEEANTALESILEKAQGQSKDDELLLTVWKAKSLYASVVKMRSQVTAWFVAAQKAHNCTGCLLEKGVFIKPEEKK